MKKVKRSLFGDIAFILTENFYDRSAFISHKILLMLRFFILRMIVSKKKRVFFYYSKLFQRDRVRNPLFILEGFDISLRVCITYRCNSSCTFCYAKGLLKDFPMDMELGDFISVVRWAKAHGKKYIMFLGGEPTIHPQFEEILDFCHKEQIKTLLVTNGLYTERILEKLKSPSSSVAEIAFSYPQDQAVFPFKDKFLNNLSNLRKVKFNLLLSGVLDGNGEAWREIIQAAVKFRMPIRWSLLLPGRARDGNSCGALGDLNSVALQLLEVLRTCCDNRVICYVYRPVPACIFTPEQWKQIRKLFRHMVYTRCPIGLMKRYGSGVTVNPDLSTYACISFFVKGPRITSFQDNDSLNLYYEKSAKDVMSATSIEKCKNCQLYQNFLSSLTENKKHFFQKPLCDTTVCQGGCFAFRDTACSSLSSI